MDSRVSESAAFIRSRSKSVPTVGVVLGSGLGSFAETLPVSISIPYESIPHFRVPSVSGHAGNLIFIEVHGLQIALMQGRFHFYEGLLMSEIVFPIRVLGYLGVNTLIVTNASGGISDELYPGSFMVIEDHINLIGSNPLTMTPPLVEGRDRFLDMTCAYDQKYIELAIKAGEDTGVTDKRGVLAAMPGPCYETPAEIRMLKAFGADAVSMSTVPEVIMARYIGMKVLGISLITNRAAGLSNHGLKHAEVIETAQESQNNFSRLLSSIIAGLSQLLS